MTPYFNHSDIYIDPAQFGLNLDFLSEAWGINPSGDMVVGTVGETNRPVAGQLPPNPEGGLFHGFTRRRTFATPDLRRIDFPNAAATSVVGCNDSHDIVGFMRSAQNQLHAFIWLTGDAQPRVFDIAGFQPVVVPPTVDPEGIHNGAFGINNNRLVVGTYHDLNANRAFGFVAHASDPATPLPIDMRGALGNPAIEHTRIHGINGQGDIVGSYQIGTASFSFKWKVTVNPNNRIRLVGNAVPLNHPGTDVVASGINDKGQIVGTDNASNVASLPVLGFLWLPDAANSYPVDNDHLMQFEVDTPLPIGVVHKSFVGNIDSVGDIVGAYRKDAGNPLPNRRAFIGFFADKVKWWPTGPLEVPFYPPIPNIPFPFPPFPWWSVPLGGGNYQEIQNAVTALFLLVMLSGITDAQYRHRLRALVLELLCEEIKKLEGLEDEGDCP